MSDKEKPDGDDLEQQGDAVRNEINKLVDEVQGGPIAGPPRVMVNIMAPDVMPYELWQSLRLMADNVDQAHNFTAWRPLRRAFVELYRLEVAQAFRLFRTAVANVIRPRPTK